MALVPAGMANLNAFLGPVMPVLAASGIVNLVIPPQGLNIGTLLTPVLPNPPGGEPNLVNYQVFIFAQIQIQGRVADKSIESYFSTTVEDQILNIQPPEEDQRYVDLPTGGPTDYAINGLLFKGIPTIIAGNGADISVTLLRDPADTATYTMLNWTARYYRVL